MILCRNIFPLSSISVSINSQEISLTSGGKVEIPLKRMEHYAIEVTTPLLPKKNSKTVTNLHEDSVIEINSTLPDRYYLIMGTLSLIVCILFFFQIVSSIIFCTTLLLYILPIVYYSFIRPDKYFSINIK
ncbi:MULTISPECIES: hypothetical protein [Capnocytophaga]|jgi:hypothetical protein|uniref:hypothetical protein n=1 Tax=Capnocytophaga TaxID=1016 RepID=UPI00027C69C6|nr:MULTISPECIES: hypothetical protein [Capnocytophaga]EJU32293.1 hypothetical protein HMPREF1154_2604 [Capnocytophaga sp. CM59]